MNSQPLADRDIGFVGVHEPIEKGPATIRGRSHPVNNKHLLNAKGVTERTKGRKKTYEEPQREYLFDQLNKHLEKALVDSCKLRRINLPKDTRHKEIGYLKSDNRKCYFQLCRTNTKALGSKLSFYYFFFFEKCSILILTKIFRSPMAIFWVK